MTQAGENERLILSGGGHATQCSDAVVQSMTGGTKEETSASPPLSAPGLKTALLMSLLCHHNHATSANYEWKRCFQSFPLSVIPLIKSH